jgi:hypothetical protein
LIFTKKHGTMVLISGDKLRPDLPQKATDVQKVAAWTPFQANAGTYEVKGNTYTAKRLMAKNPSEMRPDNFTTVEFGIEGNTLTLIPKTNQDGPIANPIITKFERVE